MIQHMLAPPKAKHERAGSHKNYSDWRKMSVYGADVARLSADGATPGPEGF